MSKRLTLEFVQSKFIERNYKPLFDEYKNAHQKLNYTHKKCGKKHSISWASFQQGEGCPICGIELLSEKQRKDFSDIQKSFKERGYKLITEEKDYKNNETKLDYICDRGHKHFITWASFQQGSGCPICGRELISEKQRKDFSDIQKSFKERGYKLITEEKDYKNAHQKLNYTHKKCGKKHSISWANFQQGEGCRECAIRYGENNPMWKGGKSFEPYSYNFTRKLKKTIKERDGNKCMNIDCWNNSKRLCIHHIDYDKNNCKSNNLITLCFSCNSRANKNRDKWVKIYTEILEIYNRDEYNEVYY